MQDITESTKRLGYHAKLILNGLVRMRDAEASGDGKAQFSYFMHLWGLMKKYYPLDEQMLMERDLIVLKEAITGMKRTLPNDLSQRAEETRLKRDFAEKHLRFIFRKLPNAGLRLGGTNAVIDFEKVSMDDMKAVVRTHSGLETALKQHFGHPNTKHE